MSDIAVKVENLAKVYQLGTQQSGSLRETITNYFRKNKTIVQGEFFALNNVSFEIKKGDAVGIIGKNGAGKSTLLKVLSRITQPTKGRIEIDGRLSSLLEVGTGFHPELSGRENIYLNGTILGMSRQEIKVKFDEIVSFSGVEKFLDTPVKRYSSGMYVRLAFAVAAHLEPEILIIDEVLAVGDAEFQRKCLGKMNSVAREGRTVLFVSHNLAQVQNLCNQGLLLKQGQLIFAGEIHKTISKYVSEGGSKAYIDTRNLPRVGTKNQSFLVESVQILNKNIDQIIEYDELQVEIRFATKIAFKELIIGVTLSDGLTTVVECRSTASYLNLNLTQIGSHTMQGNLHLSIAAGTYNLNIGARSTVGLLEYIPSVTTIDILPKNEGLEEWKKANGALVLTKSEWELQVEPVNNYEPNNTPDYF